MVHSSSSPDESITTPTRTTRSASKLLQRQEASSDTVPTPSSSNPSDVDSPEPDEDDAPALEDFQADENNDSEAEDLPVAAGGSEGEDRENDVVDEQEETTNSPVGDALNTPPAAEEALEQPEDASLPDTYPPGSPRSSKARSRSPTPLAGEDVVSTPSKITALESSPAPDPIALDPVEQPSGEFLDHHSGFFPA